MKDSRIEQYTPAFLSKREICKEDRCILLIGKKVIMKKEEDTFFLPTVNELEHSRMESQNSFQEVIDRLEYLGQYKKEHYYGAYVAKEVSLLDPFEWMEMNELTRRIGDAVFFTIAGNANHILHWRKSNQFCGCCGEKTKHKEDERAMVCTNCGNVVYPRISPATITAVFRGDEILLAHNRNFRNDMHSLIAGFVEPGETLEQCVAREIFEEVGIRVKNIQYFSSQPWPFPDSLMLAFTAEYESGEIKEDQTEITHASWYLGDQLPEIPGMDSVAGRLIRWFRDEKR